MNSRQLKSLVKQELRRGMRSQYVIFSFIIFPLFMWGIQAGVQSVATSSLSADGQVIYVANMDNDQLGNQLVDQLFSATGTTGSAIEGATIDNSINYTSGLSAADLRNKMRDEGLSPMVIIPENFTELHIAFNISSSPEFPIVVLASLPNDQFLTLSVQSAINEIIGQDPFTQVTVEKATVIVPETISFEGEEDAGDPLSGIGFAAFLTILLAVMAPAAFVSASFAGERENHTLEALLALPMGRMQIMWGKVVAGLIMTGVFAIMNLVGLSLYNVIVGEEGAINADLTQMIAITFVLMITSFVALGFGKVIASFSKDQKTASTVYQLIMLVPTMLVGFTTLFNGVPETLDILYLVPWVHSMAVLMKGLYPLTFANSTLFGSIGLDLLFHLGYLLLFVIITMYAGSRLFEREKILS